MERKISTDVNQERVRIGSMILRILTIFLLLTWSFAGLGGDLKVEVNPSKPVVGEIFQVYFKILTDSNEDPLVNFLPSNLEVVGKSNQGISTRTVYANGKLSVTREMNVVYEFVANKAGISQLKDISVQLGGEKFGHPNINIDVLKEPVEVGDVFVAADVPKKDLYLGEGITVRYYLYSKVPVSNLDVKKYPKLNHFLKRFLQEPDKSERVSVNGEVYSRHQIYAAKLFPEKRGELKIDSIHLSATYPILRKGDPFGVFGMGRDMKKRNLQSDVVLINVKDLPTPIPSNFSGLIGEHEFHLDTGKSRLIVNEPLDLKLTVTGVGALENLEAPILLKNEALEEFETNGELKIIDSNRATKIFEYTFLAKDNLTLPAKNTSLSFFDPVSEKYINKEFSLPEIVVAGGENRSQSKTRAVEERKSDVEPKMGPPKVIEGPRDNMSPVISSEKIAWKGWLNVVNVILIFSILIMGVGLSLKHKDLTIFRNNIEIPVALKKGNFEVGEFIRWLSPLIQQTGNSPLHIIKEARISDAAKSYFIELLNTCNNNEFSQRKEMSSLKYISAHYKELGRYIRSKKNESFK